MYLTYCSKIFGFNTLDEIFLAIMNDYYLLLCKVAHNSLLSCNGVASNYLNLRRKTHNKKLNRLLDDEVVWDIGSSSHHWKYLECIRIHFLHSKWSSHIIYQENNYNNYLETNCWHLSYFSLYCVTYEKRFPTKWKITWRRKIYEKFRM